MTGMRGLARALVGGLVALTLMAAAGAQTAGAQTAVVRSGEHAGFTRLVLTLPAGADWRFGRTAGGYEFDLGRADPRFDVSAAFARIPRTRLAAIWADPASGRLNLGIGCACHAMAFALDDRTAVIDIRGGPPPPGSGFEMPIDAPGAAALAPLQARTPRRPLPRPASATTARAAVYDWRRNAPAPIEAFPIPPPGTAERVETARDALLRDLAAAAAAAQGAVDPALRLPAPAAAAPSPAPVAAAAQDAPPDAPAGGAQVRVRPAGGGAAEGLTSDGRACLPDAAVALDAWRGGRTAADAIAAGRIGLAVEFDRPDEAAVLGYARTLIAFGFGAEARALLAAYPPGGAESGGAESGSGSGGAASGGRDSLALLDSLARLVDGAPPAAAGPRAGMPGPLAGMEVCAGAAALWAVLARPRLDPGTPVDAAAVARAFAALPADLRLHLGPALAERFQQAGDAATVRMLRNARARAASGPDDAVALIDARAALAAGPDPRAEPALRAVIAGNGPQAPAAMIALVEALLARGAPPDPATLTALAAAARERRGAADGAALHSALVRATAAAGDFPEAFRLLDGAGGPDRAAVMRLLATGPDDDAVLRHALGPDPGIPAAERRLLATRLEAMGFPEAALGWSAGLPDEAARLLRARAQARLGDSRAVLREIAALEGPEAAALRATALERLGQTGPALAAWQSAGEVARAGALAWRARLWLVPDVVAPDAAAARLAAAVPGAVTAAQVRVADATPPVAMAEAPRAPGQGAVAAGPLARTAAPAAPAAPAARGESGAPPVTLATARDLLAAAATTRADAAAVLQRFAAP
jgi:hypothetical protein